MRRPPSVEGSGVLRRAPCWRASRNLFIPSTRGTFHDCKEFVGIRAAGIWRAARPAAPPDCFTLQVVVEGVAGTPGETSDPALQPLLATGYDDLSGDISVSFATGCDTDDNNIYYGPLSLVSTLGFTGEVCDVGTAGTAVFNPGVGSYFFLVVGNQALAEGSYGRDGGSVERSPFAGNACGETQDLSASCTP